MICDVMICDFMICDMMICGVVICDMMICDVMIYDVMICDLMICDVMTGGVMMLSGDVNVVRRCDTHHPAPAETALAPDRKQRHHISCVCDCYKI